MKRRRFEQLVAESLRRIPRRFREAMANVAVLVEDEPSADLLKEMEIEPQETLFGLYQGTPLTDRGWDYGNVLPDRITIFQRPIEGACETETQMVDEITQTVIHEFGHYFGLTEEDIEAIEEKYWRGESLEEC